MARDRNERDISNICDGEFKAMIICIITGLEKRVEHINETINTEIRNNIAEIKGSINEMRNMLDGMNSRLEEAEEQTNSLMDKVMGNNQTEQKREKRIIQNENILRELQCPHAT